MGTDGEIGLHVKDRHLKEAKARETMLLAEFRGAHAPAAPVRVAA